jgi:hypothetical protein
MHAEDVQTIIHFLIKYSAIWENRNETDNYISHVIV